MAPKNKFTREEMVQAAMRVVRARGLDGLTAKTIADELGTSTRPIFTGFGSMEEVRQEVYAAAVRVYDGYTNAGLQEPIPFLGVGKNYIRFAREEPELYRVLFLARTPEHSAMQSMRHLQGLVRPALMEIYRITEGVVCSKRLLNQAVGKSLRTHNLKPKKGAQVMRKNEKITALYERLSRDDFGKDDDQQRESNSISNQELICKGWFLQPNTYDCGSFVVN